MHVCKHMNFVTKVSGDMCGEQETTCEIWSSASTISVPDTEFRLHGLSNLHPYMLRHWDSSEFYTVKNLMLKPYFQDFISLLLGFKALQIV